MPIFQKILINICPLTKSQMKFAIFIGLPKEAYNSQVKEMLKTYALQFINKKHYFLTHKQL